MNSQEHAESSDYERVIEYLNKLDFVGISHESSAIKIYTKNNISVVISVAKR